MEKAAKTPFAGVLLTHPLAAELQNAPSHLADKHDAELKRVRSEMQAAIDFEKRILRDAKYIHEREREMWRRERNRMTPRWYEHPAFVAVVSVVGTAALSVGLAASFGRVKP